MPKKIHYQHPGYTTPHHACGLGDLFTIDLTDDRDKVTCQMCLKTIVGMGSNRQISDRPKQKVGWRIDQDLIDAVKKLSNESGVSQVSIVESAIELYLKSL